MLTALGRLLHRRARIVALGWLVLVVLGFAAAGGALGGQSLFERLQSGDAPQVDAESQRGTRLLDGAGDDTRPVLMIVSGVDPADPAVAAAVEAARPDLAALPEVTSVAGPYAPPGPGGAAAGAAGGTAGGASGAAAGDTAAPPASGGAAAPSGSPFVATDGTALLVSVGLPTDLTPAARTTAIDAVTARLTRLGEELTSGAGPGASYRIGGIQQLVDDINGQVADDLRSGEAVALPLSLLVMVIVFGGLLAAGLPIVGAIASIGGGLAILLGFSYAIELDASVPSVVSVLGLGLCIDYGLLLVSRYREELRRGLAGRPGGAPDGAEPRRREQAAAMERTLATAGRTILFSGVTVAISLSGLMFFNASILQAVGAAGVSVVVVAVLVALTLVPALLALAGRRVLRPGVTHRVPGLRRVARRLGDVPPPEGAFSRLATRVQRRPVVVALGCLAVLGAVAVPVLRLEVVSSGVSLLPAQNEQRLLLEDLGERFPGLSAAPIQLVSRAAPEELARWAQPVADLEGVAGLDPVRTEGEGAERVSTLGVRTTDDPRLSPAREVVAEIRDLRERDGGPAGGALYVTGESAQVYDFMADVRERSPLAVGVVMLATFVLLFLMTGSVLVPVKALVMNVASLGASFGVLVWVFQDGHLEDLLGFTSNGGIDQNIPALALAFAFGLSMDYEVFLLSRIKETRDGLLAPGAPPGTTSVNDLAVRHGLQRSGRIITSAALIIVIVFAGFVTGELLLIKQIGVALAVAVAVDATVVRMLLVPATMTLLGEWNWWAPGPLRRLHDRFGMSE